MTILEIREWHERWKDGDEERPGMYLVGSFMMEPLIAVAEAAQHLLYVRRLRSESDRPMVVELGHAWDRLAKAVSEMEAP